MAKPLVCNAPAACNICYTFVRPVRVPHPTKALSAFAGSVARSVFDCDLSVGSAAQASSGRLILQPLAEIDIDKRSPRPIGEKKV